MEPSAGLSDPASGMDNSKDWSQDRPGGLASARGWLFEFPMIKSHTKICITILILV